MPMRLVLVSLPQTHQNNGLGRGSGHAVGLLLAVGDLERRHDCCGGMRIERMRVCCKVQNAENNRRTGENKRQSKGEGECGIDKFVASQQGQVFVVVANFSVVKSLWLPPFLALGKDEL